MIVRLKMKQLINPKIARMIGTMMKVQDNLWTDWQVILLESRNKNRKYHPLMNPITRNNLMLVDPRRKQKKQLSLSPKMDQLLETLEVNVDFRVQNATLRNFAVVLVSTSQTPKELRTFVVMVKEQMNQSASAWSNLNISVVQLKLWLPLEQPLQLCTWCD